jgi:hypothetical protein
VHALAHFGDVLGAIANCIKTPTPLLEKLARAQLDKIGQIGSVPLSFDEPWRIGLGLSHAFITLDERATGVADELIRLSQQDLPLSQNAKTILRTVYTFLLDRGLLAELRSKLRQNLT